MIRKQKRAHQNPTRIRKRRKGSPESHYDKEAERRPNSPTYIR
jgi:hypothetical protein